MLISIRAILTSLKWSWRQPRIIVIVSILVTVFLLKSLCDTGNTPFSPGNGPTLTTVYRQPSLFSTSSETCTNANYALSPHDALTYPSDEACHKVTELS